MSDFPIEFLFFGRPTIKRLEGGQGITIDKNGQSKLTFIDDNPFGFVRTELLEGEMIIIPSGFQWVVHGEFNVAAGATVTIEDGGALIVL